MSEIESDNAATPKDPLADIVPTVEVKKDHGASKTDRQQVRREKFTLLFKTPSFVIGSFILSLWVVASAVPSIFTKWGPNEVVRVNDGTIPRVGPRMDAWLGTDKIGNDVFARIVYGARPVLITAMLAAVTAVILGTLLGLLVGYFRGWVDEVISRVIEAFLSIPVILLAIMVVSLFGKSRFVIIATIATLFTPVVTRTIRSAVLAEAQLDYVTSAKLRGENALFVMTREILPNITGVAVVELTVRIGYAIFTVATLAFLGLSAGDSSAADWGTDIAKQYGTIVAGQWWAAIFPAIAIGTLVIAVNLVADSIERANKS